MNQAQKPSNTISKQSKPETNQRPRRFLDPLIFSSHQKWGLGGETLLLFMALFPVGLSGYCSGCDV